MAIEFNVTEFRVAFPAFADDAAFPDATLQGWFDVASVYISTTDYGALTLLPRTRSLDLLTAHLAALSVIVAAGNTPGQVQSATIDKISVTLTPPPDQSAFTWWLNSTPYGAQLAALLSVHAVGGFYVSPYRSPRGWIH
jgi:hypothetical protein